MLEADTVIGIELTRGFAVVVKVDIKADLVKDAVGDSHAVVVQQSWKDGATLDEDSLLEIGNSYGDWASTNSLLFAVKVVPSGRGR